MSLKLCSLASFVIGFSFFSACNSSDELSVKPPTVSVSAATEVTASTASLRITIINDGKDPVTDRGICWATVPNPTVNDNSISEKSDDEEFTVELTNLEDLTTYYVRAFATNKAGTSYGNEITFTTSESIFTGDVVLKTQKEVDDFGAMGYAIVNGNITIGQVGVATTSIVSLESLESLNKVYGELVIISNNALQGLTGLENLKEIRNGLHLEYLPALTNIDPLSALDFLGGSSMIFSCSALTNIDGLSGLTSLVGLTLYANEALSDINGLNNVMNVERNLMIISCESLIDLSSLGKISNIDGNLVIDNNDLLTELAGLENLTTVGGGVIISNNDNLANTNALKKLVSIGALAESAQGGMVSSDLEITNNSRLENLNGFENLTMVPGRVIIEFNASLTDYCGLQTLAEDFFSESSIWMNSFNPSMGDIRDGNCSQ